MARHTFCIAVFSLLLTSPLLGEELLLDAPSQESSIPLENEELAAPVVLVSSQKASPSCDLGSHTMRVDVRHSQGAGIGYTSSYSTLEGFFSTEHDHHEWTPFLDLQGHVFNNGKYAANAGLGVRYLTDSLAWGINSYYDYRNTRRFHYNQIGAGLEVIGSFWSLHLNGYLPVGKKRSSVFDIRLEGAPSGPSFAFFEGHDLFITLSGSQALVARQEFAMKGIDTKVLFQVVQKSLFSMEAGIGPYYFQGPFGKFATGAEASLIFRIGDYLTLSAAGSYDNLFHQRGQGAIGISIPFGPRNFSKERSKSESCRIPSFFNTRLTRGAQRSEIVVLDKHQRVLASATSGDTEVAINPATGQPYVVWFVNNQSHSDGTFESPYPTVQEALSSAQPNDMIYVYPGDGSPYDVDVSLQEGQYFLGSGVVQKIPTTKGIISIPAQSGSSPTLENSGGATMITVANQNTVSGFILSVLSAGDTVVASSINSLSFINNQYSTSQTTGMNNLALTDCTGTLLIQNNQFTMDPADTGSIGIQLSDAGSNASFLSVLNNTFTNHAANTLNLIYSANSSPTLNIAGNAFIPPLGTSGLNAINLSTADATTLAGSISRSNSFSAYTGNTINLNWNSSNDQALTISNNIMSSDPSIAGTNGILLFTNGSGTSSLTVLNNQISYPTNTGINCLAANNSTLNLLISGNTVVGTSQPGNNGIQVSASDTAILLGTITNNTCSEHLGGNINGFPNGSSAVSLTIAYNTLTGPSTVPGGSFPNGIQFSGSGSCTMNVNVHHNQLMNHTDHGINLFVSDTATISAHVDHNTLTVPDSIVGTAGIQVSASNSSAVTSTYSVTNNVCTGHTNANIQCFPNQDSVLQVTMAGNTLTGPTITPIGSFPDGIQISTSNSANVVATINGGNRCFNHIDRGINLFTSDDSSIIALIDNNLISSPISTNNTSGIAVGGNNSSSTPLSIYTITNNTCVGQNNGSIQCFPSQNTKCSLLVVGNEITAAIDGISGSGPAGIQVGANDNSSIVSLTISRNAWTSPQTYQSSGTPQGINVGANSNATLANVQISQNACDMIFTSYPANTGPTGIQYYLNNNATCSGLTISNNAIRYSTSNYGNDTGPNGIQASAQNSAVLTDVTISGNAIAFAPLLSSLPSFQQSGISLSASDSAFVGTALSPAIIEQNAISQVEGNGITLVNASSEDVYMNAFENAVSLGTVMKSELGIVTVPFAMGKLVTVIDSNVVTSQNGGFIGIVATNQGPSCQSATISNNTVTHVHGNNPAIPIPGAGGGIGAAVLGSGNLNVFITNNGVSNNTPQGIFGIDSDAFGGSGTLCIKLQDNHGAGTKPPDNYVLYNPTSADPLTFIYQNAGGNTGTLSFFPSISDFTAGTCSSCP